MKTNKEVLKNDEERKDRSCSSYSELPEVEDLSPVKTAKKESHKGKENREIRILKKSKSVKAERNDPNRFSGDGINFRAKIIGIEHVFDARGNRMCQGALQRLKAAVKTSGDHKQKIILNISLNGIIIKDEKSGELLHHHPIHKISFISQDTSDNRAFGYVYGCPQTGHRFFAIKTEKMASQVVVTLRDLFLVALEIKKKELEKTIETQKDNSEESVANTKIDCFAVTCIATNINAPEAENSSQSQIGHSILYSNTVLLPEENEHDQVESNHSESEATIDNLLDLQFEMDTLQQGISQMDHSIATAVSFSEDDVSECSNSSIPTAFHFKVDKLSSLYHETLSISSRSSSTSDYNMGLMETRQDNDTSKKDPFVAPTVAVPEACTSGVSSLSSAGSSSTMSEASNIANTYGIEDRYAVFLDIDSMPSIFDDPSIVKMPEERSEDFLNLSKICDEPEEASKIKSSTPVAFAELDPLGSHPFVDKKDFFQNIKNPPKKVLKDLASDNSALSDSYGLSSSNENFAFVELYDDLNNIDSFACESIAVSDPPKLPPKKSVGLSTFPPSSDNGYFVDQSTLEAKNPFNPFIEDYPDVPPPSSPPPPPPPRLPSKTSDSSPSVSPPPPRPPSRVNGVPTPPLPKRKVPLSTANRTWFSFDQPVSCLPSSPELDIKPNHVAPPLPSPARKIASKSELPLLKSSSASSSPAIIRRLCNKNSSFGNSILTKDVTEDLKSIISTSPSHKIQFQHSSIIQDDNSLSNSPPNPFLESSELNNVPEVCRESCSPPLPPKPPCISRPRPSPVKKVVSASSHSNSSVLSVTESSNGTHSSSSLVFSSADESRGSSSEALFTNSRDNCSDDFSETMHSQSSNGTVEDKPCDLSPDSIFHRKSDPFADDFFLSLPKKSNCDTKLISQNSCGIPDIPFDNLKAPT